MIIKSFTAETATAAMKMVRKEMGGEAIVLKTRQVVDRHNRGKVEITACLEKPTVGDASQILHDGSQYRNRLAEPHIAPVTVEEPPTPPAPPIEVPAEESPAAAENEPEITPESPSGRRPVTPVDNERLSRIENRLDRLVRMTMQRGAEQIPDPTIRAIVSAMRDADVPEEFIDDSVLSRFSRHGNGDAVEAIRAGLTKDLAKLMVPDMKIKPGDRVLFMGPSGAGKSSVMGKLATHLVTVEKRKVALSGIDFQKVGAHEELAGYADLLNLDVSDVTADKKAHKASKDVITLIDGPSLPDDPARIEEFATTIKRIGAKHRLIVLSALTRTRDAADLAERYRAVRPTHVVGTMLDQPHRQGALIAVARTLRAGIAFLSDSPGGVGRLKTPDPAALARTLTSVEAAHE